MKYKDIVLTDNNMDEELESICDFLGWSYGTIPTMEVLDEVDKNKHPVIDDEERLYRMSQTLKYGGGNVPETEVEYIFEFKNKWVLVSSKKANEQADWLLSLANEAIPYKW